MSYIWLILDDNSVLAHDDNLIPVSYNNKYITNDERTATACKLSGLDVIRHQFHVASLVTADEVLTPEELSSVDRMLYCEIRLTYVYVIEDLDIISKFIEYPGTNAYIGRNIFLHIDKFNSVPVDIPSQLYYYIAKITEGAA